ncbi:MAG: DUF6055 domain-containing protein, partial [Defluviitaleaceae bacterium]|nr:DUF6055 domain-containing protein [Defluviitaleaceae bacterium]
MKKQNVQGFSRIVAWVLSLIMILTAFPLMAFANNADLEETAEVLDFPPHWTQEGTTTLAQGNIARIATATAQHTNGGNSPANAINGTLPTTAGNNHWNSWGSAANVGSQQDPIWFQLNWNVPQEIDGLRVMWHIFTDAGVRWPNAANVQFMNDQGQWENVFPYTPLPNDVARVGVADPNSPIGVNANSGTNPANRPWPAPQPWGRNTIWNIVEFPEIITTDTIRLQIFGAKTGGNAPGVGIAALEVFGEEATLESIVLESIGDIIPVAGNFYIQSTLRAGALAYDAPGTWFHDVQVLLRWYRGAAPNGPWTAIPGANGRDYVITAADTGMYLRIGAYANGPNVSGGPVYSAVAGPVPGMRPAELTAMGNIIQLTGNLHRDSVLRAGNLTFNIPSHPVYVAQISYQWYRAAAVEGPWIAIAGATGRDYTITAADEGMFVRVRAYADGPNVSGGPILSAVVGPILGVNQVNLASIGNIAQRDGHLNIHGRLRAGLPTLTPNVAAFQAQVITQWYRSTTDDGPWTAIPGATGRDYKITASDTGMFLRATASSVGVNVLGGSVHTAVIGPIQGLHQNMCIVDGCYRLGCLVHCNTCGLIARLCLASDCEEHQNAEKITLVNFTGSYRLESSIETEHFIITWQNLGQWAEFGRPDDPRVRPALRLELEAIAAELDRIFEVVRDELGYGSPYTNHRWDTHRVRANLTYNDGWQASGGTTSVAGVNYLGNLTQSVGASRPFINPATGAMEFPTFVHEIAHTFQFAKWREYPASFTGGTVTETLAQFMVWYLYPHWFHYETHGPAFMAETTHRGFQHSTQLFRAPMIFMYWADLHGPCITGRLSRESLARNANIIETYVAYTGITQEQFNDEIFDASRRFVTWDMDHVRDASAPFANRMVSAFTRIGEWHRVAADRVPNSYGFNAVRLNVPAAGTEVTIDFRGLDHAYFPITEARRELAGWRYGFLAKTTDGTRHYGDMFSADFLNPESSGSFIVPENTAYLWLVVTGAPSQHWQGAASSAAENWGYQFRLTGTTPHSAVIVMCADCGRTPCQSPCADASCRFACCVVCNPILISATAPTNMTLPVPVTNEVAAIALLTEAVTVVTSSPFVTTLPVVWTLANAGDAPFNPAYGQSNVFKWAINLGHVANPDSIALTGTIIVTNATFGFNIFNNNNDNVPSIAGTIRMWTQLNGVNAIVPYAELDVTATFP